VRCNFQLPNLPPTAAIFNCDLHRDTLIHNWRRTFEADGTLQAEINNSPSVESELKRLRKENRQLKMERDILKKATAFFAKENG
jgi:transposase-like protein